MESITALFTAVMVAESIGVLLTPDSLDVCHNMLLCAGVGL